MDLPQKFNPIRSSTWGRDILKFPSLPEYEWSLNTLLHLEKKFDI